MGIVSYSVRSLSFRNASAFIKYDDQLALKQQCVEGWRLNIGFVKVFCSRYIEMRSTAEDHLLFSWYPRNEFLAADLAFSEHIQTLDDSLPSILKFAQGVCLDSPRLH